MLSENEFKDLALLARLDPNDASLTGLLSDFNKILEYVNTISEIEASSGKEYHPVNETKNVFREDVPLTQLAPGQIATIAPQWESGHFVVPGVIETGE